MDPFRPIPDLRALSRNYSLADVFVERIENWIVNLQKKLPPGQQLRITALLPGGREVLVEWIGYHNPNLVAINGVDLQSANACTLLAHQEAIQFLCVTEPVEQNKPRREIGFQSGPKDISDS